jgi:AcrR family transcriptional regulator
MSFETRKSQILNTAEAVFHHFGFAKTTMQDIARALQKGKSSLYHYFASKDEIIVELLHKEIAELKAEFFKAIDAEATPERKIRAYILTRMKMFQQKMSQHMSYIEQTSEREELLRRIHAIYDPDEIRIISGLLQEGVAGGRFAIDDIPATAEAMVYSLKAFEHPFTQAMDEAGIERMLDFTLQILFYGIVPRGGGTGGTAGKTAGGTQ